MDEHDRTSTSAHCDPEMLTLAALDEPALSAVDVAHLLRCPECADGLANLRATVNLIRGDESVEPMASAERSDRIWAAVVDELGMQALPRRSGRHAASEPATTQSRFRRWLPAAAAAAAVVIAVASGVIGAALSDDDEPTGGTIAAEAELAALAGSDRRGTARWLATVDGAVLHVELAGSDDTEGYLEVWLLDPDGERLVSLGTLPAGGASSADLRVPAGIAPDDYPLVDVSVEALNGDPTHSGVSVARGDLQPTD